jgi:hypothetical protein
MVSRTALRIVFQAAISLAVTGSPAAKRSRLETSWA